MSLSGLVTILLWAFAVPIVVKYRLLPVEGEPYVLHLLLFILLGLVTLDAVYPLKRFVSDRFKNTAFFIVVVAVFLGAMGTLIIDRGKVAPGSAWNVHDIIVQLEVALRYLSDNKNPYKETYVGTTLEQFAYTELGKQAVNPALYHFVMPPWYLLFSFPFYAISMRTLGYFDGRMGLLVILAGTMLVLWLWFKHKEYAKLAILITLLSPAVAGFHLEGRSDGFALFWLVFSLFFLDKGRFFWSAILMGLAVASKQTIWFLLPCYVLYAWNKFKRPLIFAQSMGLVILVIVVVSLPFLLWDAKAFVDSTVFYLSGNIRYSYPISGYGFGMLMYSMGIIKDIHQYFPFWFWQVIFGVPVLVWSLVLLKKKPVISRLLIGYGFTLFVVWYFSRYFNNSHIAYIGTILSLGMIKSWDEKNV